MTNDSNEYPAPPGAVRFMDALAAAVPAAGLRIQDERRYHHGNVHPHLEMGAVAAWFVAACRRVWTTAPDASYAAQSTRALLNFLEEHFHAGEPDVDDVIGASFLENLLGHSETDRLRALLPPKLASSFDMWTGRHKGG